MSFPTARVGFVITGDGRLLRTSDMGRTWRRAGSLPVSHLYQGAQLDFVTSRIGFALTNGRLLETVDGGAHWRSVHRVGGSAFGYVDFVDPDHGWATTPSGRIYRTVDGGRSWTRLAFHRCWLNGGPSGLSFVDTTTGFAECLGVGATIEMFKQLYETNDGGSTWRKIAESHIPGAHGHSGGGSRLPDIPLEGHGGVLLFRSSNEGLMAAGRVGVYLTSNRAHSWRLPLLTDDEWFVTALSWPSSRVAYVLLGNSGGLLRSTDGLRHWRRIYPDGPGAPVSPLAATSPRVVLGVAEGVFGVQPGSLVGTTDGGRTWASFASLPGRVSEIARGAGSVWALSSEGLFRSRDDGRTWTRVQMPRRADVTGLDAAPDGSLFLTRWDDGALYRSTDDGRSWETMRLRGAPDTVRFVSAQQGFALDGRRAEGLNYYLAQTLDGGKTWHAVPTPGLNPRDFYVLDARQWWLWGTSPCHVRTVVPAMKVAGKLVRPAKRTCTGKNQSFMLRTSDGGAHWTEFRMSGILTSPGYSFVTPQLGYATSTGGILRTTDGGRTWRWIAANRLSIRR